MLKKRMEFAKKYKNESIDFWEKCLFSDETYIYVNLNAVMNRVRRFKSSNPFGSQYVQKTSKYPLKILIWGCFSAKGIGRLQILDSYMNSRKYLEVMQNKLLPTFQEHGNIEFHLDDSAKTHRSKEVLKWHSNNNIQKIDWPGNSPDLNPIENLWAYIKNKIKRRVITNERNLITNLIRIWHHEIPDNYLKNLAHSMPSRLKKVIENKGGNTKY